MTRITPGPLLIPLALGLLAAAGATAQGWIEPVPTPDRQPRVERVRSEVTARIDVDRRLVEVEVEDELRNASPWPLEGDYLFPVPPGATLTGLGLFVGEERLEAEMLPAEQARGIYEEIVRRRRDPALVELAGHGLVRARVFPIEPGASRRVVLRYTQPLERQGGAWRFRHPRLVDGGRRPAVAALERPPLTRPEVAPASTLRILVRGASPLGSPYSPSHDLEVRQGGAGELEILSRGAAERRDFELFLPIVAAQPVVTLVAHSPAGEAGYFMLLLTPPPADAVPIPKDVTLVLDTSGSMAGEKLEQARAALGQILAGLGPRDRFRLVTFAAEVRAFGDELAPATPAMLDGARHFLARVEAEGGTDLDGALGRALAGDAARDRLSLVVLLTDGRPTVGETGPERIAESAEARRGGRRVFAFGVGFDVNTYLLDRLVAGGRGAVSYVGPEQDVEEPVSALRRKIASPALTDLEIVAAPAELEELQPRRLPDLFAGEELIVFGRYRGSGRGELVIAGRRGNLRESFRATVELPRREDGNRFVPRLWAARKAGELAAALRLGGTDPELVAEIRRLGLRYGILTEYTSYLVEEPAMRRAEPSAALDRARALAAPPAAQTGAVAFERSARSSRLTQTSMLGEADELSVGALSPLGGAQAVRPVGRRLLALQEGTWLDLAVDPGVPVVTVEPFSAAYFELLRRLPALGAYLALGERVSVAGEGLTLAVAPGGISRWSAGELARVVEALASGL